jgi:hypothetical protein
MKSARTRFGSILGVALAGSALALLPAFAGAAPEPQGGKAGGGTQRSGGGTGGSEPLKHISTTVRTTEVWLPIWGWTVVAETRKVKCGPGGTNCPFNP